MNHNITNKQKIFLLFLIIIFICGLVVFFFNRKNEVPEPAPETKEHIVPARPATIEESATTLIKTLKLARISAFKYDQENTSFYLKESMLLWRDALNEFINTPPKDVSDPEAWSATVAAIYESIQSADILISTNDYSGIILKLDEARMKLNDIHNTEKTNPEDNLLFSMLMLINKIIKTSSLDEAKLLLPELKLSYTKFKEFPRSNLVSEKLQSFENVISEIENTTPTIFKESMSKLEPIFFEIYEKY